MDESALARYAWWLQIVKEDRDLLKRCGTSYAKAAASSRHYRERVRVVVEFSARQLYNRNYIATRSISTLFR